MLRKTVIRIFVLLCIVSSAACNGGAPDEAEAEPSGDTEIQLVISDPATAAEELALLIDFVSYQITCPDSGLTPYSDGVALSGNFELDLLADPPVWGLAADLPLSLCTIGMWVFYEDQVICSGSNTISVVEDGDPATTNKVNIELVCSLSTKPPSGDANIDGNFTLVHGNYCPQLFWLGAVPTVVDATGVTDIQTSYIDVDNACGQNCDPQTCDFSQNPPVCMPAPDPGLSSTLFAPAGKGTFGDPAALSTTYTCDPLAPGPTEICVLVTDGDFDCDQQRCLTIECPDLCEGVVCDDGNECTRDLCDPLTGLCSNDPAPDGIACNNCGNTCVSGACNGPDWVGAQSGSLMTYSGTFQLVNTNLVNPYSGQVVPVNAQFLVNNTSYEGLTSDDTLFGTSVGDFLLAQDPVGTQRICGVESVLTQNSFDAVILADEFVVLGPMTIEGGSEMDLLWANVGDDILRGNNGDDVLDGGPGDDIIEGGNGEDTVTLWPGSGFDSIAAGLGVADTVQIDAEQNQILISPAADPSYEFDIFYLGIPMAQIMEVELVVLNDASIDLTTCTGGPTDVCNLCGNDAINGGEECDDGNNASGDGCAADCTAEY